MIVRKLVDLVQKDHRKTIYFLMSVITGIPLFGFLPRRRQHCQQCARVPQPR